MRNIINIKHNDQAFPYVIEYSKDLGTQNRTDGQDIGWNRVEKNLIYLFEGGVTHYRKKNDWYDANDLEMSNECIPQSVNINRLRVYIPMHSVATYKKSIRYAITANTWINGIKIDLGSFVFKHNDTIASLKGPIKAGNNEYHEYVEFDIIDPFYLTYADDWMNFRNKICGEPLGINSTGSILQVTIYIINEYENRYLIVDDCVGGVTSFNISDESDFMSLKLTESLDPLGFRFDLSMNSEYDWLLTYLKETYGLTVSHSNIRFELVMKNKDSVIVGPAIPYNAKETFGSVTQIASWNQISKDKMFKTFFSDWNGFEEGWSITSSLCVIDRYEDKDGNINEDEILTVVSNELPITQELYSRFINGGAEKIVDLNDMNVIRYNVVNKVENNILQIERPNESKSNIMQPVFFRVKETEVLTLHPVVTENICINLDDYKSKVDSFVLQINGCNFNQIGSNSYGILFKVPANSIAADIESGTYYILNEDLELITTGKYNCVR